MNLNLELWGILTASLLGSWHCVGMCGPFVSMQPTRVFYHFGRLFTYSVMTTIFFVFSIPVKALVGTWLIYGIVILWLVAALLGQSLIKWQLPKKLIQFNQKMSKKSGLLAGFSLGAVTTLLPCVWLYGFVGLAITKETLHEALIAIFIFWIGTVPALIAAQILIFKANSNLRRHSRKLSMLLMVILSVFSLWSHRPQKVSQSCPIHQGRQPTL